MNDYSATVLLKVSKSGLQNVADSRVEFLADVFDSMKW
jgi:hypothetical protein